MNGVAVRRTPDESDLLSDAENCVMKHGTHPLDAMGAPLGAVGKTSLHSADAFLHSASARYFASFRAGHAGSASVARSSLNRCVEGEAVCEHSLRQDWYVNCAARAVNTAFARLRDQCPLVPESPDCVRLFPVTRVLHGDDRRSRKLPAANIFTLQENR